MAIKPIKGFYLHDEATDTDGVAKYDAGALANLDDTVKLRGYAPDAKAVGDKLSAIEETASHADELATILNEGGLELKDDVVADNVEDWLDAHPEATTTVQDGSITKAKINTAFLPEVENENATATLYSAGGLAGALAQPQLMAYTGKRETINTTVNLDDAPYNIYAKSICNTQFVLNTDLFTWNSENNRQLPTFVNCVFWGNGGNLVAEGLYIATAKFINCVFYNCSVIDGGTYAQSCRFTNCRFMGSKDIINAARASDVQFVQCQGESDFTGKLVCTTGPMGETDTTTVNILTVAECVFEGNQTTQLFKITGGAKLEIVNSYIENYTQGLIRCINGTSNATINIIINNVSMRQCGNPIIYIDETFTGRTAVSVTNAKISGYTTADLLNRYDLTYLNTDNINATSVIKYTNTAPSMHKDLVFASVDGSIQTTAQLEPESIYLVAQGRVTYTGCVLYMVVTDTTGIIWQKIADPNNRWTLTDEGGLSLKIVSGGYGLGTIVKIR